MGLFGNIFGGESNPNALAPDALSNARAACLTALQASNYAEARRQCVIAMAFIASIPSGSAEGFSQSWTVDGIEKTLEQIERLEAHAGESEGCAFTICEVEYGGIR